MLSIERTRELLREGIVIPAVPLALTAEGGFSERHQRALIDYYLAAGAGGLAICVHSTQFALRERPGLYQKLLELVRDRSEAAGGDIVKIAGICGEREQALAEARIAAECGFEAGMLSVKALGAASDDELVEHHEAVAQVIPVMGFYLQPKLLGRKLGFEFWRRFFGIENVLGAKTAPFDPYETVNVVRALVETGRQNELGLATGNDNTIVQDLVSPYVFEVGGESVTVHITSALLGQFAVWTKAAVELLKDCRQRVKRSFGASTALLTTGSALTRANRAIFDAENDFAGCIPGIHYVLNRQGLLPSLRCLDPQEKLSPGQQEGIDLALAEHPELSTIDNELVAEGLSRWLGD